MEYRVRGRVIDRQGAPITGLLVHALDLDPRPTTGINRPDRSNGFQRIGSAMVVNGAFDIAYRPESFAAGGDGFKGPDLVLRITGPEGGNGAADSASASQPLYVSETRTNAGRAEEFNIILDRAAVDAVVPRPEEDRVGAAISRVARAGADHRRFEAATKDDLLEQARARLARSDRTTELRHELREHFSKLPTDLRRSDVFVSEDNPVARAVNTTIAKGLQRMRARAAESTAVVPLSSAKIAAAGFSPEDLAQPQLLTRDVLSTLLFGGGVGGFPLLRRIPVPAWFDVEGPVVEACEALLFPATEVVEPTVEEDSDSDGTSLTERLRGAVAPLAIPGGLAPNGLGGRLSADRLSASLAAMESKPGPADVAQVHDVNVLHIAFEHVWQELADEEGISGLADAYTKLVDPDSETPGDRRLLTDFRVAVAELVALDDPPLLVAEYFGLTAAQWRSLPTTYRHRINEYAAMLATPANAGFPIFGELAAHADLLLDLTASVTGRKLVKEIRARVDRLLASAQAVRTRGTVREQLDARRRLDHPFTVFAADKDRVSVNYGLLTTYRQTWTPVAYQVGELARTVTLAPNETRKYTVKTRKKTLRDRKQLDSVIQDRLDEQSSTGRAEEDIARQASVNTNASIGYTRRDETSASVPGVGGGELENTLTTSFSRTAAQQSNEAKKRFREAVTKASLKVHTERKLEVQLQTETTVETEESGEIGNPNDELTCTYMFYELQRRYRVSEQIHAAQPVIMVAQRVPRPDEIDEDWVLTYDWILRDVIADDTFLAAIDYLRDTHAGAETLLASMEDTVRRQRDAIDAHRERVDEASRQVGFLRDALDRMIQAHAAAVEANNSGGWFDSATDAIFGEDDPDPEASRLLKEAAQDRLEAAQARYTALVADLRAMEVQLVRTEADLAKQRATHDNHQLAISRLLLHIKENILYYMKAIWAREPADQRFFRLVGTRVPVPTDSLRYRLRPVVTGGNLDRVVHPDIATVAELEPVFDPPSDTEIPLVNLEEIADIERPLGFKGNYIVLPLHTSNLMTDFMLAPYLHPELVLQDPDPERDWTATEFARWVCWLAHTLPPGEFAGRREELAQAFTQLRNDPSGEFEIVVPSGSLYIEALPGSHAVLEDFKLFHRGVDAAKAESELRARELENVRYAMRLAVDDLSDPEIDKHVTFSGSVPPPVTDTDDA